MGIRPRHLGGLPCANQTAEAFGLQLVEHLNGVTICGLGQAPDGCSRQSREVPRRCQRIFLHGSIGDVVEVGVAVCQEGLDASGGYSP